MATNRINSINDLCDFISFSEDLSELNIFKLMNLSLSSFSHASHLIKDNSQDLREKVKEVYIKTNLKIFNFFTSYVYKEYSDDSSSGAKKQTFFYTNTDNIDEIFKIYSILVDKFGECIISDDVKAFTRENIENISKGYVFSEKDECHAIWIFKNLTFRLQYHTKPAKQFVINILQK